MIINNNFIHNTINIVNSNINILKTVAKRVLDWGCLACWILSSSDVTAFIKYESEIFYGNIVTLTFMTSSLVKVISTHNVSHPIPVMTIFAFSYLQNLAAN